MSRNTFALHSYHDDDDDDDDDDDYNYVNDNNDILTYLLTYLLTYSMEQSPSWEANRVCS